LLDVTDTPGGRAANDALLLLLAEALMVSRRSLQIVSGLRAREKRIAIQSPSADDVRRRLNVR
jgi:uncharacterized protein YggU (UPF0235/DUF167 family)